MATTRKRRAPKRAEDAKETEALEHPEPAKEPPKPKAPPKRPTGRYHVLVDGKVVGDPQPTKMHALRASVAYHGSGLVTVAPEMA